MRGFQKGITLRGRTPGSARKVSGRWWWVGGGLLDFRVYLSPLLGEGVWSMIERCSREGSERVREGEGRDERGEERDCDNFPFSVMIGTMKTSIKPKMISASTLIT